MRLNPSSHSAKQSQQRGWFEVSKTVLAEPDHGAVTTNRLLQKPFPAICHKATSSKMRLRNKSHFASGPLQNATACCGFLTRKKKSALLLALSCGKDEFHLVPLLFQIHSREAMEWLSYTLNNNPVRRNN